MSRTRSRYEIERDARVVAAAQHAAVVAQVRRAARTYRAQGLAVAKSVPALKSIRAMTSAEVRAETARLESALADCQRASASELDQLCQAAFDEAFASARERIAAAAPEARLSDQRLVQRDRSRERTAPAAGPDRNAGDQLADAVTEAQQSVERILARLTDGATAESRASVVQLAAMVGEATNPSQVEQVVMAVRTAVESANEEAALAQERSQRVNAWTERLHLLEPSLAQDLQERLARLEPDTPWPGGLAEAIEDEVVAAERTDERERAMAATRAALESMGYSVTDEFTEESFVPGDSFSSIPNRPQHRLRTRARHGRILMDIVRVEGQAAKEADRNAEQTVCDALAELKERTRRSGVALLIESAPATGDIDQAELELPAESPASSQEATRPRSAERRRSAGRDRERRR